MGSEKRREGGGGGGGGGEEIVLYHLTNYGTIFLLVTKLRIFVTFWRSKLCDIL